MKNTLKIIDVLLVILLLIFVGQNLQIIKVKLLVFAFDLPLAILIAVVFFIGYFTARSFYKKK